MVESENGAVRMGTLLGSGFAMSNRHGNTFQFTSCCYDFSVDDICPLRWPPRSPSVIVRASDLRDESDLRDFTKTYQNLQ